MECISFLIVFVFRILLFAVEQCRNSTETVVYLRLSLRFSMVYLKKEKEVFYSRAIHIKILWSYRYVVRN